MELANFRRLGKKHGNTGIQVLGGMIAIMALSNVFAAFSLQCVENKGARTMNKVELLLGGASMAFGAALLYGARSKMITKSSERLAVGVASIFLMTQAIVSFAGQSGDGDCKKGLFANLGNIASVVAALLGIAMVLV